MTTQGWGHFLKTEIKRQQKQNPVTPIPTNPKGNSDLLWEEWK